ncbi:MAG TPA: DUF2637 domain-containing protein [Micromonosporaceae bacterium]|nr:DUF2637 domain-containing protein [Micromonosporaceae bacterium]
MSVAANVAHSYIAPDDVPAGWAPERGQVFGAAFWPLALAVSSEVLARTTWGKRGRLVGVIGVALVALVAAVVSYIHLHGLLVHWNEHAITTWIGPLAVDGLMVVSTAALLAGAAHSAAGSATEDAPAPGGATDAALASAAPSVTPRAEVADAAPKAPARPATPAATVAAGGSAKPVRQAPRRTAGGSAKPPVKESATPSASGGDRQVADPRIGGSKDEQVAWLADQLADPRGARTVPAIRLATGWSEGTARRRLADAEELAGGGPSATETDEMADESARAGEM